MKITRSAIICLGVLFMAFILGSCVAITLLAVSDDNKTAEWVDADIEGTEFMQFYDDNKKSTDRFSVTKVMMRQDGNFMQGFYYDADEE